MSSSSIIISAFGNLPYLCSHSHGNTTVAVCITDKASMVFGGSDEPLALGCLYSLGESNMACLLHYFLQPNVGLCLFPLGAINVSNNGKIQNGVTDALEPYGVTESRIYINFFDMPRENVGWNRATFGG